MSARASRNLFIAMMLAATALFMAALGVQGTTAVIACSAAGLVVMVAGVVQLLVFHRCPACRRILSSRSQGAVRCPHCGARLEETANKINEKQKNDDQTE